ncbi:hypothetical protein GCM10023107_78520 [Actinoplanes octamycinicus]|nr:hypothetical protein Aoc01nite_63160 [Actinoplanes octamycinicus]
MYLLTVAGLAASDRNGVRLPPPRGAYPRRRALLAATTVDVAATKPLRGGRTPPCTAAGRPARGLPRTGASRSQGLVRCSSSQASAGNRVRAIAQTGRE